MMKDIEKTFSGRSVFVTGHTGFKGSWLTIWLSRLGAKVTGYSLAPPTTPCNFVASRVRGLLANHVEADVRDGERLYGEIGKAKPDFIFHLAAQPLVRESYRAPRETFDTNVMGTVTLLDAVRRRAAPCTVLVVTSDKCYENREQVWGYRESDPMGGNDPYSASKGAAEVVTASYRSSFFPLNRLGEHGIRIATARAGNVFGGGDWAPDRIVTDVAEHLSQTKPVPLRNPRSVRPWQHVLEPLWGYLLLASRLDAGEDPTLCSAWNFGPFQQSSVTTSELVEIFCKVWGSGSWVDAANNSQPHEAKVLRLCVDKAASVLGWRPRWPLDHAVERTAAWYKMFYEDPQGSMLDRCRQDILDFESSPSL